MEPLQGVRQAQRHLADAERHAEECRSTLTKQQSRAIDLHERAAQLRSNAVHERATPNAAASSIKVGDVLEVEMEAEAADLLAGQLSTRVDEAEAAVDRAKATLRAQVRSYVGTLEDAAIRDIEQALEGLVAACGRAIGAAKVIADHRESGATSLSQIFGSAGKLVTEFQTISWPNWPKPINDCGLKGRIKSASHFPGVSETIATISAEIQAPASELANSG